MFKFDFYAKRSSLMFTPLPERLGEAFFIIFLFFIYGFCVVFIVSYKPFCCKALKFSNRVDVRVKLLLLGSEF